MRNNVALADFNAYQRISLYDLSLHDNLPSPFLSRLSQGPLSDREPTSCLLNRPISCSSRMLCPANKLALQRCYCARFYEHFFKFQIGLLFLQNNPFFFFFFGQIYFLKPSTRISSSSASVVVHVPLTFKTIGRPPL